MTRPPRPDDPDADAPEWWRRSAGLRRIPIIAVILVTVIIIVASQGGSPPALRTSCTTPAFALSTYNTPDHHAVQWSVTGPKGMLYQLTVGVRGFTSRDDALVVIPDSGLTQKQTQAASPQLTMPNNCRNSGTFGVIVPPGKYQVRLFRLTGTKQQPSATEVAVRTLVVTDR